MPTIFDELLGLCRAYLAGLGGEATRFAGAAGGWLRARELEPMSLPCLRHLEGLAQSAAQRERPILALLARNHARMRWGQTYTTADFAPHFLDNYGWLELIGTRGHFACDRLAAGFLILGPGIVYPDHHHVAEELYVPLSGAADWRKGGGGFMRRAAGEVIHHPSMVNHAMRTHGEPLIALYLWRGGPLAEKSTVTGKAGAQA